MKKKILSGIFALALLVTAGYGVDKSMKSDVDLSDLALSNVEALATGETGNGVRCCEDPGDICVSSSGQKIQDFDEC